MKENLESKTNSINESLKQVKDIIDTETVIGKEIKMENGTVIVPISKVIVGYIGGGGEYFDIKAKKQDKPFANGCGTGAYIKPIGFLVINSDSNIKFLEVDKDLNIQSIIEYFDNIFNLFKGEKSYDKN